MITVRSIMPGPARRAVRLEQATIAYNVFEGIVAVTAGVAAGLISLGVRGPLLPALPACVQRRKSRRRA